MRVRDIALAILIMAVWGFNLAIAKLGLVELPPMLFLWLRFFIVAVLLVPLVRMPRGRWRDIGILAFLLGCLHFPVMFSGIALVDAAVASILSQIQVPVAAGMAALFLGDRIGWRRMLGMALAIAGVAILAGAPSEESSPLGVVLVLVGALAFAAANFWMKRLADVDPFTVNGWVCLLSLPAMTGYTLALEDGQWAAIAEASATAWFSVAFQSVGIVILSYAAWYRLLRRYSVAQTMPFVLLLPIFGVLGGVLLRGEPVTWPMAVGGVLTLVGVAVIILRRPAAVEQKGSPT